MMNYSWSLMLAVVFGILFVASSAEDDKCSGQKEQLNHTVEGNYEYFLENETFSINCSIAYEPNNAVTLSWVLPDTADNDSVKFRTNRDSVKPGEIYYNNITIVNAGRNYAGTYRCAANRHCKPFEKIFLEHPKLDLSATNIINGKITTENKQPNLITDITVTSYPPATFSLYRYNILIGNNTNNTKYEVREMLNINDRRQGKRRVVITVSGKNVEYSGEYTLVAQNGYLTENVTLDITFYKMAEILNKNTSTKYCDLYAMTSLECEVTGYPPPIVLWSSGNNGGNMVNTTKWNVASKFRKTAILDVQCKRDMNITCYAHNNDGRIWKNQRNVSKTTILLVNEVPDGFGIKRENALEFLWFPQGEPAVAECYASIHKYNKVTWELDGETLDEKVVQRRTDFSYVAKLEINKSSEADTGTYVCRGFKIGGANETEEIDIEVEALSPPQIVFTKNFKETVIDFQPINMSCSAYGVPRPTIVWLKDNELFVPQDTNITNTNTSCKTIKTREVDYKTVSSVICVPQMEGVFQGRYECKASNSEGTAKQSAELILKKSKDETAYKKYVIAIVVVFVLMIAVVVFLVIKLRRDKAKRAWMRKELEAAGLGNFKKGQSECLNPDLGIDKQADLLPYDEKFEFPPEKLLLGHQLGAGAFGVVFKAEARGIINAEETTPVAVKMVQRTADNLFIKALATELKIMVHLGKHVNIVNLLGACTKNVNKRELSVIVEYCRFGNIHNYMQKHREVFIDQFSDNVEKNFGKDNRGYDSSGSTGFQSDYGTANTQHTDNTILTNNTNRSSGRKPSEGYVMQPEWRSNYVSENNYDGRTPRPLTSRDLLCWAFQVARGMEYLASRKILHGDLAARNILLADDNVVKICDFGLARVIYDSDEYKKKEDGLLPVKWLAIECINYRIFSTQSDVWSFGIVLWEMFTLAKTPYPNMDPCYLKTFLEQGRRLEKPAYSDDRIYNVMLRCWAEKPTARPTFTQLQEELGNYLEDDVRAHYVDLNNVNNELNTLTEGQQDYLAMVRAPDYNNMVTPSPHHYVNEIPEPRRFFPPTPTKIDEDGYLQMTPNVSSNDIYSPKCTATRFDFEPRKLNSRPSEASSVGSELTPMLSLTNLPRNGSDSDQEGEGSVFPFSSPRYPTINEETVDDVFSSKENIETYNKNAKNALNTAVSNPTYITYNLDVEKKPKDVNSYMNIKPNGLVK